MKRLRNHSLSLVFLFLFLITLIGQAISGWKQYNEELSENGAVQVTLADYLTTAHFAEATFENWESEFLQMALFVLLTIFLYQKGSSESKDPDKKEEVDKDPTYDKENAPWPVKRGGFILVLYENSLSIAFTLLFILSFVGHLYSSFRSYNEEQLLKDLPTETLGQFIINSKFWFESFQNWQSEFLSVLSIVVLSIFLRQKNSPQSKPVDAPDSKTGE